jgi:hypothetical protein
VKLQSSIPQLPCTDLIRAVQYYTEFLEFTKIYQDANFAIVHRDNAIIHLWGPCGNPLLPENSSCYINVVDIDDVYLLFRNKNVAKEIITEPWGKREFYLKDSEGNLLKFGETVEV